MYEWNTAVLSSEKSFANTEDRAAKNPEMIANGIKEDAGFVMDNLCAYLCLIHEPFHPFTVTVQKLDMMKKFGMMALRYAYFLFLPSLRTTLFNNT